MTRCNCGAEIADPKVGPIVGHAAWCDKRKLAELREDPVAKVDWLKYAQETVAGTGEAIFPLEDLKVSGVEAQDVGTPLTYNPPSGPPVEFHLMDMNGNETYPRPGDSVTLRSDGNTSELTWKDEYANVTQTFNVATVPATDGDVELFRRNKETIQRAVREGSVEIALPMYRQDKSVYVEGIRRAMLDGKIFRLDSAVQDDKNKTITLKGRFV